MNKLYCIACPNGCLLTIIGSGAGPSAMVVENAKCDKGREFAVAELTKPTRTLTTTVRTNFPGVPVISVRTDGEIPIESIADAMLEINEITVEEELAVGDAIIEDVADTGVRVIITSPALMQLGAELENKSAELTRVRVPEDESPPDADDQQGDAPNAAVLDEMDADYAGGVVGAAGEAVGVEEPGAGEEPEETAGAEDEKSGEGYRAYGRARIGR